MQQKMDIILFLIKIVFVNSLFFLTANGERKGKSYVKHSKIIYDSKEQVEIIKKEINDLMALNEMGFDDAVKIEYILRHLIVCWKLL